MIPTNEAFKAQYERKLGRGFFVATWRVSIEDNQNVIRASVTPGEVDGDAVGASHLYPESFGVRATVWNGTQYVELGPNQEQDTQGFNTVRFEIIIEPAVDDPFSQGGGIDGNVWRVFIARNSSPNHPYPREDFKVGSVGAVTGGARFLAKLSSYVLAQEFPLGMLLLVSGPVPFPNIAPSYPFFYPFPISPLLPACKITLRGSYADIGLLQSAP